MVSGDFREQSAEVSELLSQRYEKKKGEGSRVNLAAETGLGGC